MGLFNIYYRGKEKTSESFNYSWEELDWTDWAILQYNVPANLTEERLAFWRKVNESVVKQSKDRFKIREYKAELVEET